MSEKQCQIQTLYLLQIFGITMTLNRAVPLLSDLKLK